MFYFDEQIRKVRFIPRKPELSFFVSREKEIELFWLAEQERNPALFNGMHFSCNGTEIRDEQLLVYVNPIEYKLSLFAMRHGHYTPGVHPIGIGAFGFNPDTQCYTFVQRGNNVSVEKNQIHLIGGSLEYNETAYADPSQIITQAVVQELQEEVDFLNTFDLDKLTYLFAMYDNETTSLVFRFYYKDSFLRLAGNENSSLITVPETELQDFLENHKQSINTMLFNTFKRIADTNLKL